MSVIAYWLAGKLGITSRLASFITWAGGLLLAILAVWFVVSMIRSDARDDLRAEQAETQRRADDAQRDREAFAAGARNADLAAGAETDAVQQKEITDATKDLADSRPTARQRARVCVELHQQDKAAGRAPRPC